MKKCFERCIEYGVTCPVKDCRLWIKYPDDLNCTVVAANKNGRMTLREVAARIGISFVAVKHIEDRSAVKLCKKLKRDKGFIR